MEVLRRGRDDIGAVGENVGVPGFGSGAKQRRPGGLTGLVAIRRVRYCRAAPLGTGLPRYDELCLATG